MYPGADIATSQQHAMPPTSAAATRDHAARAQAGADRSDISPSISPYASASSSASFSSSSSMLPPPTSSDTRPINYSHLSPAYPAPLSSSSSPVPSPTPGPAPPRLLSTAPRSSSLPFASMGNSPSKSSSPAPQVAQPPPPSAAGKLLNAAVAGNGPGFKLKRAFAARRKKSEDSSAIFNKAASEREQDARQYHPHEQTRIDQQQQQQRPPRHTPTPLPLFPSASSPAQVNAPHSSSPSQHSYRGAKQLTQLATNVFHKKSPKSPPQSDTSPTPPPPPPKSARHARNPAESSSQQTATAASSPDRLSIMALSPGISSAVTYMRMGEEEKREQEARGGEAENAGGDKTEMKEAWRKSDSTMSHHTIRPGATTATRGSRPVSMAESVQSTHTIVPVTKRLSALIGDADFGMPEEEDDSFHATDNATPTAAPAPVHPRPSPASSVKNKNRRSMSLNLGSPFGKPPAFPLSASATDLKQTSVSISEGMPPTPPASDSAHGFGAPTQSARHNLRGRLAGPGNSSNTALLAPPVHPERTLPALPPQMSPSFRQTAISMTSGFAPAASGLAKRAVEKMGRAWGGMSASSSGSGYSSSASSSNTAPSSFSSSHMDYGLSRTSSNTSNPSVHLPMLMHPHHHYQQQQQKGKQVRRTPNAPSGSYSIASSMTSGSDSDAYLPPPGPVLGRLVRGPIRGKVGSGGVVFGKDLRTVVRDTAVSVGRAEVEVARVGDGSEKIEEVRKLEERRIPALVVRCAQHLLVWGIQEEGLFRVSGRASHVSKIRAEFDTGADYDMMECTPGDLDPHAVASVFKAYLRELPEPIMTQKLAPYFEAVINKEHMANASEALNNVSAGRSKASGLPSNPRGGGGGFPLPAIRKPPSLSTLAMPSFSGMPPPSKSLLNALSSLIAKLPQENRDLVQTVTELIRATAKESKETKMPLSNLLLVFCPSLNMSPPLLRVLCEVEGIWSPVSEEPTPVMDIKRESVVLDISAPDTAAAVENDDADEEYSDANDEAEEDSLHNVRRAEEDTRSVDYDSSAEGALDDADPQRRWTLMERPEVPTVYLDTKSTLSSSSSIASSSQRPSHTRDTSATSSSLKDDVSLSSDDAPDPSSTSFSPPPPLSLSAESVATPPTSSGQPSLSHLPLDRPDGFYASSKSESDISGPPKIADTAPYALHSTGRRPTISNPIPISSPVQFPSSPESSPSPATMTKRRSIPLLSLPNFSPLTSSSSQSSPSPSPTDSVTSQRGLRSKKPSLRLLFSKRSVSSLNNLNAPSAKAFISAPILPEGGPYTQNPGSASSDSSISTPRSVVTAPQASVSNLPPVLDTPIEGPSLGMGPSFDVSSPSTASTLDQPQETGHSQFELTNKTPFLASPDAPAVSQLRPNPTSRTRVSSVLSTASSNHLGLLNDDEQENWTQSVLLAADVNGDWIIQRPEDA